MSGVQLIGNFYHEANSTLLFETGPKNVRFFGQKSLFNTKNVWCLSEMSGIFVNVGNFDFAVFSTAMKCLEMSVFWLQMSMKYLKRKDLTLRCLL